jgi:pimeloyl-ACP methyl ester carboxylesterase
VDGLGWLVPLFVGLPCAAGCRPTPKPDRGNAQPAPVPSGPGSSRPEPVRPAPIHVDALDPSEQPPTFVLHGARGRRPIVFLHGLCGHAQGYVQSFQFAAAAHGPVVAPQGDVPCGAGPWSTWSGDPVRLDRRITRGFATLGLPEPRDVTVIGYSLGATLAEGLARRWPDRYTRLILIAAPQSPNPQGMKQVRSTVMLAGTHDRQELMRRGVGAMRRAGIPSTFLELPGATHGEMGPDAERVMGEALAWVFAHQVASATSLQRQPRSPAH